MKDWFAMWGYSCIGEYPKAMQVFDEVVPPEQYTQVDRENSLCFSKFKPVNAISYTVQQTKDAQVITINEAHYVPQHRTFTASQLEGLYGPSGIWA